jgi:uncharacterized protein YqgQ
MIKEKVMGYLLSQMGENMRGIELMEKELDTEFSLGLMDKNM